MNNYVLLYNFEDHGSEEFFEKEINERFPRNKTEESSGFKYFGFAAREEPGVVDTLNTILNRLGIGTKDYVALYYTRQDNPDNIKRTMVLGHDDLVETKVEKISFDNHRNSLTRLLDFDFVKAMPEPDKK